LGRRAQIWVVLVVLSVILSLVGPAGAQTDPAASKPTSSEPASSSDEITELEGRVAEQDAILEERMAEISAVGQELEEVQARRDVARSRAQDLGERTSRLERELDAQQQGFKAAKASYEERARAAYKGEDLEGLASLVGGMLGSGVGPAAVGDARIMQILDQGRESLKEYKEIGSTLRDTSRQTSQKRREYEEALAEEQALVEELGRREEELDAAIERLGESKKGTQDRLRELRAAERERALEARPAAGGWAVDPGHELRVAREEIVASPVEPIPEREYMRLYVEAAEEYGFAEDWYVLAAVGYVESNHGMNMGPSTAGAMGPMQFLPSTWETAGVDGNGDGVANIMDPEDSIPAAAGYLQDGGAPEDWYAALFTYNHADWYVKKVLGVAEAYRRLSHDDGARPYV
jgi:peptidoglycan hydrolase CwlO-like protein